MNLSGLRGDGHRLVSGTLGTDMKNSQWRGWLVVVFVGWLVWTETAAGQQHRATRLGDPAHRFAPPLTRPEQLRELMTDERMKPDIAAILEQAGWPGRVEDLIRAAGSSDIKAVKLPYGTRMPFMSSRNKGKPVALIDVLWVGKQPIDAYAFVFSSLGRRYRCVTPKPCSNFYVEDLGPVPVKISIHFEVVDLEDPIPVGGQVVYDVSVTNQSSMPLTGIKVYCEVPGSQEYVSGSGVTRVLSEGNKLWMEPLPVLEGLAVGRWRLVTRAVRAGDSRIFVKLICDQLEKPFERFEATQLY